MKARMYKYIFSLLLLFVVLSGNSQTINGRLYTQFNNYYKWRGGAFDSVLLLPNLTATAGLRGGALRYSGSDSSLYVWTGFQWRKIDGGGSTDTTSLSNRINLKLNISDTANMLLPYLLSNVAAATYQPIGNYLVSGTHGILQSLTITGTNGNGHIHLRHQSSLPIATGQSTVIYANSNGDFAYKNDGNYHTTFVTSANTGDRSYTFQNKSYTVADNAEVVKYTDTSAMLDGRISSITLNTSGAIHTNPITFNRVGGAWSGTMSLTTQSANRVFAGPSSGSAATPTFRALVDADIPSTSKGVQWGGVDSIFAKTSVENGFHLSEDLNVVNTTITTNTQLIGTLFSIEPRSGNAVANNDTLGTGIRLGTSTSASSFPNIYTGQPGASSINFPTSHNDWNLFSARVRVPILNDGTQRFVITAGLHNQSGVNQTDGFYFTYDLQGTATSSSASANWQTVTASGNSRTFTTTSVPVAENTYIKLSILYNRRVSFFYINGILVATHNTNIPTSALPIYGQIVKTAGTTARTFDIDYFTLDIKYATPR